MSRQQGPQRGSKKSLAAVAATPAAESSCASHPPQGQKQKSFGGFQKLSRQHSRRSMFTVPSFPQEVERGGHFLSSTLLSCVTANNVPPIHSQEGAQVPLRLPDLFSSHATWGHFRDRELCVVPIKKITFHVKDNGEGGCQFGGLSCMHS